MEALDLFTFPEASPVVWGAAVVAVCLAAVVLVFAARVQFEGRTRPRVTLLGPNDAAQSADVSARLGARYAGYEIILGANHSATRGASRPRTCAARPFDAGGWTLQSPTSTTRMFDALDAAEHAVADTHKRSANSARVLARSVA